MEVQVEEQRVHVHIESALKVWNTFPPAIRNSPSTRSFHTHLETYFFRQALNFPQAALTTVPLIRNFADYPGTNNLQDNLSNL